MSFSVVVQVCSWWLREPISHISVCCLCCCFRNIVLFSTGPGCQPCVQHPSWRTSGSHFVRSLPFYLPDMGDPSRRVLSCRYRSWGPQDTQVPRPQQGGNPSGWCRQNNVFLNTHSQKYYICMQTRPSPCDTNSKLVKWQAVSVCISLHYFSSPGVHLVTLCLKHPSMMPYEHTYNVL